MVDLSWIMIPGHLFSFRSEIDILVIEEATARGSLETKWLLIVEVLKDSAAAVLLDNYPFQLVTMIQVDEFLMFAAVALTIYSGVHYLLNNYKLIKLN